MEPTTFLIAFTIWCIIGFGGMIYIITRTKDFTIIDLFFSTMLSICGLTLILFIIIDKYGDIIVFKKRIK